VLCYTGSVKHFTVAGKYPTYSNNKGTKTPKLTTVYETNSKS